MLLLFLQSINNLAKFVRKLPQNMIRLFIASYVREEMMLIKRKYSLEFYILVKMQKFKKSLDSIISQLFHILLYLQWTLRETQLQRNFSKMKKNGLYQLMNCQMQ